MLRKTIDLWETGEYTYPCAGEFLPNITAYLHDDEKIRPAAIVVPGGAYEFVSPTEGEIVAMKFYEAGYQAFVLTYTTNMFRLAPLKKQPLRDISRAVRCVRKNAEELHIIDHKVVCCGFSAGAHLTGSLAVHYGDEDLKEEPWQEVSNRPDAVILSYPVITSGEKAHRLSFELLLGAEASEEELTWASLEKQVTPDTPPTFLWQTFTDQTVPVDNSILFAKECRSVGVPCEIHLFMEGKHGMSLANEDWAENRLGDESIYTMLQQWQTMKTLYAMNPKSIPEIFVSAAESEDLKTFAAEWVKATVSFHSQEKQYADESVRQWISLAFSWLDKILV